MKKVYKRWTKKEERFIADNIEKMTIRDIADKLKRTEASVTLKIFHTKNKDGKIEEKRSYRPWTAKEEEELLEMWGEKTGPAIARILGRNTSNVYAKIKQIRDANNPLLPKKKSEITREKFENAAFQRMINEKVIAGVFKKDLKIKLGQVYEIERAVKSLKDWNKFNGKCIAETKDHITIKNKVRAETFLKVDFLINEYKIKEIA